MRARDLQLLDSLSAIAPIAWNGPVWRVCAFGRDPVQAMPSQSRWCDGTFDALYTAQLRHGAIMEIYSYLSMQPVFPSRAAYVCHELRVATQRALNLVDMDALSQLGVDIASYAGRDYQKTQPIANAAHFLGFDGLLAPSARFSGDNLVLFPQNLGINWLESVASEPQTIDWKSWRTALASRRT
jgi:hypothetical protein